MLTPLNIPNVDDLVLDKVVASKVGQHKVPIMSVQAKPRK